MKLSIEIVLFKLLFLIVLFNITSCIEPVVDTQSEYISEVFEYVYAPGQHAKLAKSTDIQYFTGNPDLQNGWLYLGGYGGFVIAGFDHDIKNHEGFDFEVFALKGTAPEPAIVYVMSDKNNNNLPDDTWYELKGSEYENSVLNYSISYIKPQSDSANVICNVTGRTVELHTGYGSAFTSVWWWNENTDEIAYFEGTLLPDVYENNIVSGIESWTVIKDRFEWGYAENMNGTDYDPVKGSNKLDISNAVDYNGDAVHLDKIRFIKVQTSVFQQAGWLNEVSSELRGAHELK